VVYSGDDGTGLKQFFVTASTPNRVK